MFYNGATNQIFFLSNCNKMNTYQIRNDNNTMQKTFKVHRGYLYGFEQNCINHLNFDHLGIRIFYAHFCIKILKGNHQPVCLQLFKNVAAINCNITSCWLQSCLLLSKVQSTFDI